MKPTHITSALMHWHQTENDRPMPWKGEKDPYKIWLSEVILQQTRVEQGWKYYENFLLAFPTIHHLAAARDEAVFKLWEGLGYYNRCKNLLFTAREIVQQRQGRFPETYEEILSLKGVGPYTAAAISSFAYNLPYAVVDGNVFRVLARLFSIATPIDSAEGKKQFSELAQQVLDKTAPGLFNQAMMDFGATLCKPALPRCGHCPLRKHCRAYREGKVSALPVKEKVLQKKTRWLTYFLLQVNGQVLVHKRTQRDIWENLYEFYLVENEEKIAWDAGLATDWLQEQLNARPLKPPHVSGLLQQQLTHQYIKSQFVSVELTQIPAVLKQYQWHPLNRLAELAFPKLINNYLQKEAFQPSLF